MQMLFWLLFMGCTVSAWLIGYGMGYLRGARDAITADVANDDMFAARMRIASAETDAPVNGRLPCPRSIPVRVAGQALDVCTNRALDPKTCVYADMARGFENEPELRNTAENASRCTSDHASYIGVACWMSGRFSVCNTGCGDAPEEAVAQAKTRCEDKQQRSCPITGAVPVAGP